MTRHARYAAVRQAENALRRHTTVIGVIGLEYSEEGNSVGDGSTLREHEAWDEGYECGLGDYPYANPYDVGTTEHDMYDEGYHCGLEDNEEGDDDETACVL